MPPAKVGWSSEQRRCHALEVRGTQAVAEDEDQRPRPRQVRNQTFQLAAGSLMSAAVFIACSSPSLVTLVVTTRRRAGSIPAA